MSSIKTTIEKSTEKDSDGNIHESTTEKSIKIERIDEPEYIKIYTNMWCEFNDIPQQWRGLFLQLVVRMNYANLNDRYGGQLVCTSGPFGLDICRKLGWGQKTRIDKKTNKKQKMTSSLLSKGLKILCECNAIKRIDRGIYQINPSYAGKGEWKYNPRLDRGGIENIKATFNFKNKNVDTRIIWADDGEDNGLNEGYRNGLNTTAEENTILSETIITPINQSQEIDDSIQYQDEKVLISN